MVKFIKKNNSKGRRVSYLSAIKIFHSYSNNKNKAVVIKIAPKRVKSSFKSDYIAVGYDENNVNRLYFVPADSRNGFSCYYIEKEEWYKVQIVKPKERIPNIENFNGGYTLHYDEQEWAYYIDNEKRFTM